MELKQKHVKRMKFEIKKRASQIYPNILIYERHSMIQFCNIRDIPTFKVKKKKNIMET